jgi:hypothetical protein
MQSLMKCRVWLAFLTLLTICIIVFFYIIIQLNKGYVEVDNSEHGEPQLAANEFWVTDSLNVRCWQRIFEPHGDLICVKNMRFVFLEEGIQMIDAPQTSASYYVWGGRYRFPRGVNSREVYGKRTP